MSRLMVVDDRVENRALVRAIFEPLGHHVSEAASGAEALEAMAVAAPDLLITDVLMPGMDGFELMRRLGGAAGPRPKVLFWTAYFLSGTSRELAETYGVAAVIAKPTEARTLLEAVQAALATGAPSSSGADPQAHLALLTDTLSRTVAELEAARQALDLEGGRRAEAEEALRRREQQLQQAHKMEAVGRLAGGVAHDFNNLLQVIHATASELQGRQEVADADVGLILEAVARAAAICRQLMNVGRKNSERTLPFDLAGLVAGAQGLLAGSLRRGQRLDLAIAAPTWIQGERVQMEQVLMNLVLNARDACGSSGAIKVAVRMVGLDAASVLALPGFEPGDYACLEVLDNGPGLDPAVREHLFEAYFTTKTHGTGLGLATVHAIVRRHGGHIQVDSRPREGCRFRVLLPLSGPGSFLEQPWPDAQGGPQGPGADPQPVTRGLRPMAVAA